MVVVDLSLAVICFLNQCHPVLVGDSTLPGVYELQPRIVLDEVYRGSVLQYDERGDVVYAIHRIIPGRTLNSSERRRVTAGCINVSDEVYEKLIDCCSYSKLTVKE